MTRGHLRLLPALGLILSAVTAADAVAQSRSTVAPPPPPALQAPAQSSPTPIPPMPIPNVPGPTIVAPSGVAVPPPAAQTPLQLVPGAAAQAMPTVRPGEGALFVTARFGRDAPAIGSGLHWRIYAERPDQNGVFRLVKED